MLTGPATVTTPCNVTMLAWWNCPMMAASCRNLTFSTSDASFFSVFMATSTGPSGELHTPFSTHPNCPEPRCSPILIQHHIMCIVIQYRTRLTLCVVSQSLCISYQLTAHKWPHNHWLVPSNFLFLQRKSDSEFDIHLIPKCIAVIERFHSHIIFNTFVMLE